MIVLLDTERRIVLLKPAVKRFPLIGRGLTQGRAVGESRGHSPRAARNGAGQASGRTQR